MSTTQTASSKKRFASLDLLKLICCVFVIGVHTMMNYRIQGDEISYEVLFVESFLHCCVPVFLMTTGFFLFSRDRSLKEVFSYIFLKIAFPTILVLFFLRFFGDFLYGNRDVLAMAKNITSDGIKDFFLGLLCWTMPEPNWYLWYITTLVKLYLLYPIIKHLCKEGDKVRDRDRYYVMLILGAAFLLYPTLRRIFPILENRIVIETPISDGTYIYVFIGYEFYRWYRKRREENTKAWLAGFLILYLASGILTFLATKYLALPRGLNYIEIFMANSNMNIMLQAVGLFGFFLLLPQFGEKISRLLSLLSGNLLWIYLIHYPVILVFINYGIVRKLDESLSRTLFYPVYVLSVFLVCLVLASLIRFIGAVITRSVKKVVYRR